MEVAMSLSKVKSCMNLRFSCQQNSFKYSWRYLSLSHSRISDMSRINFE